MTATRVLVAARLSRLNANGDQGRIDRDDADAQAWAERRQDVEIVSVSEDAGVSGATSPFQRPSLGPWLTEPELLSQYDEIVASSIDRLGRNARDLQELRNWAEDNGKTIRILKPELTWPLPSGVEGATGRIVWEVLGAIAQIERELTKERYEAQRRDLTSRGALVGKPPWGYMVTGDKFNKTLIPDPALVPYLRGMVERAMKGESYLAIARWLDAEKVPSRRGGQLWSPSTVRSVLTNPSLMGRRMENGKVVLKFDGILTAAQFRELQQEFDRRPKKRGPNDPGTAMLTGVIFCEHCDGPMYRHRSKTKRKDGTHSEWVVYRCKGIDQAPSKCGNAIKLDDAENRVNRMFTKGGPWATTELFELATVPGDDHGDEIAELEAELRTLDFDDPDFATRQRDLMGERARLKALPVEAPQTIEVPTGRIVGDVWPTLSDAERRKYLLAAGVKLFIHLVGKDGNGKNRHTEIFSADHEDRITGAIRLIQAD